LKEGQKMKDKKERDAIKAEKAAAKAATKGRAMASTIVGEKGQIVIPKVIRDMFEINPGDRVIVLADKKRGIAIVKEDGFLNMAVKAMDNNE